MTLFILNNVSNSRCLICDLMAEVFTSMLAEDTFHTPDVFNLNYKTTGND